jgi:hypothetical protein
MQRGGRRSRANDPSEAQRRFEIREHRGDTVAGAVAHFQRAMRMDVDQSAKAMKDAEMEVEIEDFLEGFKQPAWRGTRVNGERVPVWSSRNGWSGM